MTRLWHLHFYLVVGLRTIILAHGQTCLKRANTTMYGFSRRCSIFGLTDSTLQNTMPSGEQVSFNITTYYNECAGFLCKQSYPICSVDCPCCKPYMGHDPGFHLAIWAPNNESSVYMQNFSCVIPEYLPVYTGSYFFTCNFSGYAMASSTKAVQVQLTWDTMQVVFGPLTVDLFIVAGKMSLPDCIWQWERGNTFPLNEYGVFRILLYDGCGNKISGATGGSERSIVPFDAQFLRFGTPINETVGGLQHDVNTTWKLTYQIQFGYCIITVYCTSVGKYHMKVIDKLGRVLGNTPTTFTVMPDEAWTGTKFIPPPAPRTFFVGDDSEEKAIAGVTEIAGMAPAHVNVAMLLSIVLVLIHFPLNIESVT